MASSLLCFIFHPSTVSSTRHMYSSKECPTVSLAQALPRTILLNYFYLDFSVLTSVHIVSVCMRACMSVCRMYLCVDMQVCAMYVSIRIKEDVGILFYHSLPCFLETVFC